MSKEQENSKEYDRLLIQGSQRIDDEASKRSDYNEIDQLAKEERKNDLEYRAKNTAMLNEAYHEVLKLTIKCRHALILIAVLLAILSLWYESASRLLEYLLYALALLLAFPTVKGFRRLFDALINWIQRWDHDKEIDLSNKKKDKKETDS